MNNHRDHFAYFLGKSEVYLITLPNLKPKETYIYILVFVVAIFVGQNLTGK